MFDVCSSDILNAYPICIPVAVQDPIPLWHFRKWEILQKIDLVEDKYGEPTTFDESLILAHVAPMASRAEVGSWGYGVVVYGCCSRPQQAVGDAFPDSWYVWLCIGGGDAGHQGLPLVPWQQPVGTGKWVSLIEVCCVSLGKTSV